MPDLALSGAVFALLYLLLVFGGPSALFRDADAGWHIRAGERMIASRTLPVVDSFSFSKAGAPWIAWEWAADIAVGGVYRASGLAGVAFLYCLAIGASVWIWFRLNWAAGGNFLIACLFAAPLLSTTNLHWLARPHVFGWLFALGAVWFCEALRAANDVRRAALGVALISAVWANVHGSFVLGPAIFFVYALGAWVRPWIWGGTSPVPARSYFVYGITAFAGSLVNPHGLNLHRHVFAYLADSALLDRIGEFQSFNFHAEGSAQIAAALLIGFAGGCAAISARKPERFLLSLMLTAGALRSARMLPVAALLLLPLANGSISDVLTYASVAPRLRRALDRVLDYGAGLRAMDRGMSGVALVPILALLLFGVVHALKPGFPPDQFPVAAASAVQALPADAKLFSSDKFGGYLIYRFAGERKVFFDGRSDFYGAEFLKSYSRLVQARPGWRDDFARHGFTHALIPPDYALVAALEAEGWKETYRDRTAVLLKSPQGGLKGPQA
jgi:hypothetical protein